MSIWEQLRFMCKYLTIYSPSKTTWYQPILMPFVKGIKFYSALGKRAERCTRLEANSGACPSGIGNSTQAAGIEDWCIFPNMDASFLYSQTREGNLQKSWQFEAGGKINSLIRISWSKWNNTASIVCKGTVSLYYFRNSLGRRMILHHFQHLAQVMPAKCESGIFQSIQLFLSCNSSRFLD